MLTDNEIIKALEICASGTCEGCNTKHGYDCVPLDMGTILSLINRQKAEIERLTAKNEDIATQFRYLDIECERLEKLCSKLEVERTETQASMTTVMLRDMELALETAKAEAIKEFEDRLKAEFDRYGATHDCYAVVDNVAKGMGVDTNE